MVLVCAWYIALGASATLVVPSLAHAVQPLSVARECSTMPPSPSCSTSIEPVVELYTADGAPVPLPPNDFHTPAAYCSTLPVAVRAKTWSTATLGSLTIFVSPWSCHFSPSHLTSLSSAERA